MALSYHVGNLPSRGWKKEKEHQEKQTKKNTMSKKMRKKADLEARSKKAGFYVHGHKNLGDVYEE